MSTSARRTAAVLTVLAAAVLSSCGSDPEPGAAATSATSTTTVARPVTARDEVVATAAGGMHLRCTGTGATTVLLLAGWGDGDGHWDAIRPRLTARARVCSYARFGTGTSDPPPSTQTFTSQAAHLHELLVAAGEPGPYVVVGHSFGGTEAVAFAAAHPDEVVGLALLDGTPAGWPDAICAVADDASDAGRRLRSQCAAFADPTSNPERIHAVDAFAELARVRTLGDLPMVVLEAAALDVPGLAAADAERLAAAKRAGMRRWASLSSSSRLRVLDAGHYVHLERPDEVLAEVLPLLP